MEYSLENLRSEFDSTTYQRGLEYADAGRVLAVLADGDYIEGLVKGSGRNIYTQSIGVDLLGGKNRHFAVKGECSCPVGYNCKHVAAVLIQNLRESARLAPRRRDPIQPALPPGIAGWMNQIDRLLASAHTPAERRPAAAKPPAARLVFVLHPPSYYYSRTGLVLSACKARLRASGEIAAVDPVYDLQRLIDKPPSYVHPEDNEPLGLLLAMHRSVNTYAPQTEPAGKLGAQLLRALLAENRLYRADSSASLSKGRIFPLTPASRRRMRLAWREQGRSLQLGLMLDAPENDGSAPDTGDEPAATIFFTDPPMYLQDGRCGEADPAPELAGLKMAQLRDLIEQAPPLDNQHKESVARALLAQGLHTVIPLPHVLTVTTRRDVRPEPVLILGSVTLDAGRQEDFAQPAFLYEDRLHAPAGDAAPAPIVKQTADGIEHIERDPVGERAMMAELTALGLVAAHTERLRAAIPDALTLPTQAAWMDFAREQLPLLEARGWRIEKRDSFRYDLAEVEDWYAEIGDDADRPGSAWFDLELGVIVDGERISLLPVLVELIRHAPLEFNPDALARHDDTEPLLATLPNGKRVALPWGRVKPILNVLGELYFTDKTGGALRLSALDAARLAELESAAQLRWLGGERIRRLGERIARFGGIADVAPPAGLKASLRNYQHEGLAWLQFLREYDLAGILADDMGLGKTIQTLAHILLEKEAGRLTQPALVVAPTSLMGNWQDEAARFAPSLRVLVLQGKERHAQFERIGDADLVLTTYALLPRDEELLRAQAYHLVILDEAHYIKNARSKAAQAACLLRARHRVCLTGTPMENHLGELWSQFHFLLPGLLGDDKAFGRDFRAPIEKHGDEQRRAHLMRRLTPFILRRTKDKVATELPPKTEMVRHIDISGAQRDLYETVRLAMDKKVRGEIAKKGIARSQIVILEALLKLRQVCCDPRLVKSRAAGKAAPPSAKLTELMDMLESLLEEGRRILVFSQFTSMLALIEKELHARGTPYALLTGDTEDRAGAVRAFQRGDVPLFLISLKAGGVGLNLTAADTVIHYDPWWNPAVENQATDRAWRIGQDKPVFVYKLIAKGTLEEKIQALQQKKSELARAILGDGQSKSLKLTQEDLQGIFAPLE